MADHERVDDLVKRLRDAHPVSMQYANGSFLLSEAADEIERLRVDVDGLTAQVERMMAYTIIHNSCALYCSSAMRDAYSDMTARAKAAEAAHAALRERIEKSALADAGATFRALGLPVGPEFDGKVVRLVVEDAGDDHEARGNG